MSLFGYFLAPTRTLCHTVLAMADRKLLVILKYVNKAPSLASCAKCQRKFFTPNTYFTDPVGAEQYLLDKFDRHHCSEEPGNARWQKEAAATRWPL
jgi:hypothetical protein